MTFPAISANANVLHSIPSSSSETTVSSELTGAYNRVGLSLPDILNSNTPFKSEEAYKVFTREAFARIAPAEMANEAFSGLTDPSFHVRQNCSFLGTQAINIVVLKEVVGSDHPSLVKAQKKLCKLIERFLNDPQMSISSKDTENPAPHEAGQRVKELIDKLIKGRNDVLDKANGMVDPYLRSGLVKAANLRLGGILSAEDALLRSVNGSMSRPASDVLVPRIERYSEIKNGEDLTSLIRAKFDQLDLHMSIKGDHGVKKPQTEQRNSGGVVDRANEWFPAGTGHAVNRIGDISVPVEINSHGSGQPNSDKVILALVDTVNATLAALVASNAQLVASHAQVVKLSDELRSVHNSRRVDTQNVRQSPLAPYARQPDNPFIIDREDARGPNPQWIPGGGSGNGAGGHRVDRFDVRQAHIVGSGSQVQASDASLIPAPQEGGGEVNVEDASVQEAANVVRMGIQQLGQPSRISSLDADERESNSGIDDEDPAPLPPPPLPPPMSNTDSGTSAMNIGNAVQMFSDNTVRGNYGGVIAQLSGVFAARAERQAASLSSASGNSDLDSDRVRHLSRTGSVSSIGHHSSVQTDPLVFSLSRDLVDGPAAPQDTLVLGPAVASPKRQSLEIKHNLLPRTAPFLPVQIESRKEGRLSPAETGFYQQIASAIQGTSRGAKLLKEYIRAGKDPFNATGEVGDVFRQACAESKPFETKVKSLLDNFKNINVLTPVEVAPSEPASSIDSIMVREAPGRA